MRQELEGKRLETGGGRLNNGAWNMRQEAQDSKWEMGMGARFRFGGSVGFDGSTGRRLIRKDGVNSSSLLEHH